MMTTNEKNSATFIHLSTLTQYFIPFGNYIFPILIWSSKKNESEFVDFNGKQTLNFQLSMFLYSLLLLLIAVPIILYAVFNNVDIVNNYNYDFDNFPLSKITGIVMIGIIAGLIFCFMKAMEFFLIIHAAVKSSNGENYKYPLSIPFFK
ncbi:DUF4870 domain-containing protein [Flavobacterium sp.]|uniref:DUF4870 domain-containing protein n=1 Tax=Flavobacterium sp. TaxID=239 RepID=UPI00375003F5